jgi:hypothetical protein
MSQPFCPKAKNRQALPNIQLPTTDYVYRLTLPCKTSTVRILRKVEYLQMSGKKKKMKITLQALTGGFWESYSYLWFYGQPQQFPKP